MSDHWWDRGRGVQGLTVEELEGIFQSEIAPILVQPDATEWDLPVRQEHARAVLVVAQPGAALGSVAAEIRRDFEERGGLVDVVKESFRPYHPEYDDLKSWEPHLVAGRTEPAARWWANRTVDWLRQGHYNVLVEDWSGNPTSVLGTAERFDDAAYDVHLVAAAVPSAISRLGIIEAFAKAAAITGTGPWISSEDHNLAYDATEEALHRAVNSPAVSRITVQTGIGPMYGAVHDMFRHGDFWRMRGPDGQPLDVATRMPADVLTEARERRFTPIEQKAIAARLYATQEYLQRQDVVFPPAADMGMEIVEDLWREPVQGTPGIEADFGGGSDLPPEPDPGPDPGPDLGQ